MSDAALAAVAGLIGVALSGGVQVGLELWRDQKSVLVRVPIFPVAHAFRAGSRIRVTVQAPGGDRPRWDFDTIDNGRARNTVSLGGARASSLVLPVIAGATAKGTPLPGATALRGQPSRAYGPASNGG